MYFTSRSSFLSYSWPYTYTSSLSSGTDNDREFKDLKAKAIVVCLYILCSYTRASDAFFTLRLVQSPEVSSSVYRDLFFALSPPRPIGTRSGSWPACFDNTSYLLGV